ncbi:MAG: sulfite exporter TauE/SafE family protein [Xanthobacteraceae bacterium]|jgi:uncharacterized membrane protein YfcA
MQVNAGLKTRALIYVTADLPLSLHQPVITDPLFYLLAIPAVTLLGLGKGGFAGVGMIATPLLALIMPPLEGAAILLPLLIIQDAISVWAYRRAWSAWNLKVLIPGSVLGMAAGTAFASSVSNAAIELTIGCIGLCFVLYHWLAPWLVPALRASADQPRRPHIALGVLWGAMSGFMSLLVQVGAPPFQIHILPQRLDKLTLVGTSVIFFAFMNEMKIVPYFMLGQFSLRNFTTSMALLPLAIAANFLGIWLVHKTPTARFYQIAYILMLLISLGLLWQGWHGLGR